MGDKVVKIILRKEHQKNLISEAQYPINDFNN